MLKALAFAGRFSPPVVELIREAAGDAVDLHLALTRDEVLARLGTVEIAFGDPPADAVLAAAPPLRWLQVSSAGAERVATPAVAATGVVITCGRGVYGPAGAEHLLGLMLMFVRQLKTSYDQQKQGRWDQGMYFSLDKLQGKTLGIVGLGDIGTSLARRAKALEMTVLGLRRRPGPKPDYVDRLYGPEGLHELLAASDHVTVSLPLTTATRGLIDAAALATMKPTAYLYNNGRGPVVDEAALIEALRARRIAGAGLDVFETEPLPASSPLWSLPNVVITPHIGAGVPEDWDNAGRLFARNLRRYLRGEPLESLVDLRAGY